MKGACQAILLTVEPEASAESASTICWPADDTAAAAAGAADLGGLLDAADWTWDCHAAIAELDPAPLTRIPIEYSLV